LTSGPVIPSFSRRRYARYEIAAPLLLVVYRPGTILRIHGRSLEIGEGGIRAVLSGEVRLGERVDIEFTLPFFPQSLRMRAVVRHQAQLQCGVEFLSMTSEQREVLQALAIHPEVARLINAAEHGPEITPAAKGGIIVCASCGNEYEEEKHFCILCGTAAAPPAPPEPETIEERIPAKIVSSTTWIPQVRPTASHYAGYQGRRGSFVDSVVAIIFLITLCIGLWQWLLAPSDSARSRPVQISLEDVLVRLGPSGPVEKISAGGGSPENSSGGGGGSLADRSFISAASQPIPGYNTPRPRTQSIGQPGSGSAERKLSRRSIFAQGTAPTSSSSGTSEPPKPTLPRGRRSRINGPPTENTPADRPAVEPASGSSLQSLLLDKVLPTYPTQAQQAQVQGEVVLQALIAKDGTIADLRPVSGPQVLSEAAMKAVRQWRFKPYLVDGKPVEVQTNIRVNFNLPK